MILVGTISGDMPFPGDLVPRPAQPRRDPRGGVGRAARPASASSTPSTSPTASSSPGKAQNVLVIGGEILSRYVDWTDRNTCVLFGDGAGAVLLQATKGDHGILGSMMKSNGNYHDFICMPGGGSDHPANDPKSIEERLPVHQDEGQRDLQGRGQGDGRRRDRSC